MKGQKALDKIGVWWHNGCSAIAIESVLYWISHLQCCVLATHNAVVKVQGGCNWQGKAKTNTGLVEKKCLSCVHMPHRSESQLCNENIRRGDLWLG